MSEIILLLIDDENITKPSQKNTQPLDLEKRRSPSKTPSSHNIDRTTIQYQTKNHNLLSPTSTQRLHESTLIEDIKCTRNETNNKVSLIVPN